MELQAKQRGIPIDFLDRFLAAMQDTDYKFAMKDGSVQRLGRRNFPFLLQAAWNEEDRAAREARTEASFVPPTQEEVAEYFKTQGISRSPQEFWLYYQSRGWKSGKTLITDWKALANSWEIHKDGFSVSPRSRSAEQRGSQSGPTGRSVNIANAKSAEQNYHVHDFLAFKGLK